MIIWNASEASLLRGHNPAGRRTAITHDRSDLATQLTAADIKQHGIEPRQARNTALAA
jgi:hypothetical protein